MMAQAVRPFVKHHPAERRGSFLRRRRTFRYALMRASRAVFVATVEFFEGTNSIGIRTNNPASAGPMNPFCMVLVECSAGPLYSDGQSLGYQWAYSAFRSPVHISVQEGTSNFPPVVRITSPPKLGPSSARRWTSRSLHLRETSMTLLPPLNFSRTPTSLGFGTVLSCLKHPGMRELSDILSQQLFIGWSGATPAAGQFSCLLRGQLTREGRLASRVTVKIGVLPSPHATDESAADSEYRCD